MAILSSKSIKHTNDDVGNPQLPLTLFTYSIGGLTLFTCSVGRLTLFIYSDGEDLSNILNADQQFMQSCGNHNTTNPFFVRWSNICGIGKDCKQHFQC